MDGKEGAEAATRLTGHLLFFTSPFFVFFVCLPVVCVCCFDVNNVCQPRRLQLWTKCRPPLSVSSWGRTLVVRRSIARPVRENCKV